MPFHETATWEYSILAVRGKLLIGSIVGSYDKS